MICPFCGEDRDKVIDSRSSDGGKVIRRRRECLACGRRMTTYERVEETVRITVVKKDSSRVPYSRDKLIAGLRSACYKRKIPAEQFQQTVENIEDELFRTFDREVHSRDIGRIASDHLRRLDQVAYVRFASVYKQFRDLDELLEEIRETIATGPPPEAPGQAKLF